MGQPTSHNVWEAREKRNSRTYIKRILSRTLNSHPGELRVAGGEDIGPVTIPDDQSSVTCSQNSQQRASVALVLQSHVARDCTAKGHRGGYGGRGLAPRWGRVRVAAPSAPGVAATSWQRPSSAAQTRPHPLDCRGGSEPEPASLLSATARLGEPEREDTWPRRGGKLCAPLGSQYTEKYSIKRNLGEAGNHQVIEATQGAEGQT
ncbi:cAMP-dependent protein kinase inhibitor beta isoform X1 [Mustela nigripes]|uniref:cAMP-dependent protein kinase inhibitor beta isoform X1 n=1 Tax=Mustela nigripes TaxID=77151 RepID=UPI0028153C00|nr:cAMP-dependent protein kinase inhibitor beta isoform X1 [Mustela nigripes]XP_059256624.1 cAMP-dependent protein kinase inhibitor beta isoform X1 [Mustela nigripes]XP_059256625.1 cAMP-dependent protein kinase inhibitor beta isoform X1 [Mustela nigripes]